MATTRYDDTMVDTLDASSGTDGEFPEVEATGNRVAGTARTSQARSQTLLPTWRRRSTRPLARQPVPFARLTG